MVLFAGFDIGVKNLSFCVIDSIKWRAYQKGESTDTGIVEWQNLTLMREPKCIGVYKSGKKKGETCGKAATFISPELKYCGKQKPSDAKPLKKQKVKNMGITKITKKAVERLDKFRDLFEKVSYVYIELQPMLNPTMRTFSNAIQAYFVIRYQVDPEVPNLKNVKYSSAKNKLKLYTGPFIECNLKGKYARTKQYAKSHTEYFLKSCPEILDKYYNGSTKKDDLADSFLHCIYGISQFKLA